MLAETPAVLTKLSFLYGFRQSFLAAARILSGIGHDRLLSEAFQSLVHISLDAVWPSHRQRRNLTYKKRAVNQ
jgi:hypothetical protein